MTPGGVPRTPKAPAKTSPSKPASQPPPAERPSSKGAQAPNALEALRSHRGPAIPQTVPDEGAEAEQGFVGRRVEGAGRNVERLGAGVERTGRAIEASGAGVERTGRAVEVGGEAAQAGGRAAEAGGKAAQKGGKALREGSQKAVQAGAKLTATGKGAIVGIPIAIVGAAGVVVGGAAEVGGKASEVGGKGTQEAGKAAARAGKATKEAGAKTKEAGTQIKDAGDRTRQAGQGLQAAGGSLGRGRDMAEERAIKGVIAASGAGAAHQALSNGLKPAADVAEKAATKVDLTQKAINRIAEESGFLGQQLQKRYDRMLKRANVILPGAGAAIRSTPALTLGLTAAFSLPVLLVLVLIMTLLGGGSPVGTAANPEPAGAGEAVESAQPDTMAAYRTFATRRSVPWPVVAGIGYLTSQHQTVHPYSLDEMTGGWPRARSGPAPDQAPPHAATPVDAPQETTPPADGTEVSATASLDGGHAIFSQTGGDPLPSPTPPTGEPLPAAAGDSGDDGFFDDDGAAVIEPTEFVSGGYGPFLLSEDYLDGAFNWSESNFAGNPQMGDAALDAILTEMNAYLRLWLDGEVGGPTEYINGYLGTSDTGDPAPAVEDDGIDADALVPELEADIVSPEGWVIASGSTNASGQGTPVAYTVEVEDGVELTAASVAETVDTVLLDHRSWAAAGRPLQRTASLTLAQVRVVLVSDATKDSLCGPDPVCVSGNVIAIGINGWTASPDHFSSDSDWRTYLLNHAIGIHFGQAAGTCDAGHPAPVTMRQFTATDLGDCVAGPWVNEDVTLGGGGFAQIDLDPDAITQLIRVGNMDHRFLTSDQDWETHLAYWRMALEAIEPMVDLTDVQICTLPVHGLTTPQKIDRAVRCEALDLPIHLIDPVTGNAMDRNDAVNLLGQEAVQVAWLYNEWGQKVPCDSDRGIGGIFPVPPSPLHDDDNNPDTPPVPYYDRCDEATNLKIAMVGHHSLPPGIGLIDQHAAPIRGEQPGRPYEWILRGWGWNAGIGGLYDDGIFDKAAGNDNFPADGPAVVGQWIGGGLVCDQALLQFTSGLVGEDYVLPDTWRLPSAGGLLLDGPDALRTLWVDLRGMEQWDPVDQACAPPYPDGEPNLDRLFAYEVFDAFRSVSPDLSVFEDPATPAADEPSGNTAPEAVRRLYSHAQAQAFRSEDGQSVLASAQWGVTSSVSRLANPAIIVEVPTWTPAAHPDFANYVMAYALSMIGEDCGGIGFGSAGTTLVGTTDLSTGAGQLSWEEIAQIAYDAGFRGEDLITAVALTQPESGRNPSINNAGTNTNGTIDYGLWQINDIHNPPIPGIYDPVVNARFAYDIYRTAPRGGGYNFTPWSAFNAGRHTQWLDEARAGAEAALGDRINDPPPEGSNPPLPGGQPAGTQAFAGACMTVGGLSLVGANGLVCPNAGPTTFWNDWGASRGGGSRTHKGLDMFAAVGVPIVANESGTIGYSGLSSNSNPGNRVQLRGDSGNHWLSLHMDSIDPTIAPGVRVQQGQVLGTVGYTGNAYGTPAHNHHQFHPNGGASSPLYDVMRVVCAQNMGTTTGSAPGGMDQTIFASATSTKCMPARTCSGQPG